MDIVSQQIKEGLGDSWQTNDAGHLVCTFTFDSFRQAVAFVNQVVDVAEQQQHHPDITISYDTVTLTTWTHETNTLTQKDIRLAKAINQL